MATSGTQARRPRSLSGLAESVACEWPSRLSEDDQQQLLELMNCVLAKETTIGFPGPLAPAQGRAVIAGFAEAVACGDKHVLLFRTGEGRIIGQVTLTPNKLPNCCHLGEISRTFVHPDYRGLAVVRLGMQRVLDKCESLGIEKLHLDVRAGTRVHQLWQLLGFQEYGRLEDYARVNGEQFTGAFMTQTIAALRERHG